MFIYFISDCLKTLKSEIASSLPFLAMTVLECHCEQSYREAISLLGQISEFLNNHFII